MPALHGQEVTMISKRRTPPDGSGAVPAPEPEAGEAREREEEKIDESVEESFPASDPPARSSHRGQ